MNIRWQRSLGLGGHRKRCEQQDEQSDVHTVTSPDVPPLREQGSYVKVYSDIVVHMDPNSC